MQTRIIKTLLSKQVWSKQQQHQIILSENKLRCCKLRIATIHQKVKLEKRNCCVDIKVIICLSCSEKSFCRNPLLIYAENTLMNNTHGALTHVCVCVSIGKGKEKKRGERVKYSWETALHSTPPHWYRRRLELIQYC